MAFVHKLTRMTGIMVILGLLFSSIVTAQESHHDSNSLLGKLAQITVSGEGMIATSPDMATVEFAVVSRNERPDFARKENETEAAKALNAVRGLGILEKDIQMRSLQLSPIREYDPDRRTYIEDGYEASRSLVVTLRNLDSLPDLIAALVENGANRLNSIQYGLDDADEIELQVLRLAVARAKTKAMEMASELGMEVGAAIQLQEQGISMPRPVMRMEAAFDSAMKSESNPDAYASGQIEVRAHVTAVFILK